MFSVAESDALHTRARAFIAASLGGAPPTEPFDGLALDLARFQAANIPAFARLARARGADLASARDASAIPAVPTDVFRLARLAVHPASLDTALFRTSGTTQGARGEHPLRTTATYELAALGWGERFLWPDGAALAAIVLAPPAPEQPDSSLGFMLDRFTRALAGPSSFHVRLGPSGEASLDLDGIARAAARARALGRPVIVLATSFALVHLLDQAEGLDLRLPERSRVMQTGGFKGRSREVAPDELCAQVASAFGVPQAHVVGEYGMTGSRASSTKAPWPRRSGARASRVAACTRRPRGCASKRSIPRRSRRRRPARSASRASSIWPTSTPLWRSRRRTACA